MSSSDHPRDRDNDDDLRRQILAQGLSVIAGAFAVLQLLLPLVIALQPDVLNPGIQDGGCQALVT
ncbi:hypothetical protein AB4305_11565 [Nocardia sp. 2YAB30]|uniref:hypothetical protein n=1 Tax=unclassified Nocardia TaxID=2637762 RepID=UPI003F94EB1C